MRAAEPLSSGRSRRAASALPHFDVGQHTGAPRRPVRDTRADPIGLPRQCVVLPDRHSGAASVSPEGVGEQNCSLRKRAIGRSPDFCPQGATSAQPWVRRSGPLSQNRVGGRTWPHADHSRGALAVIGRLPHARFRALVAAGYGHFACGFSVVRAFMAGCFLATRVI
jgi:hypothetical protein